MEEKLLKIYNNSGKNKFVKVKFKDGRVIDCTADTFTTVADDNDEDLDITALSVIYKDGSREPIIENDIEEVII